MADVHVVECQEETHVSWRALRRSAQELLNQISQLAYLPHGGGPRASQDRTSICCLGPYRPSQTIEFVFAASPETIRREPQGLQPIAQSAICRTWQPARCV